MYASPTNCFWFHSCHKIHIWLICFSFFPGDNDVFNQPSLLSDLDSLTEPPSLESLSNMTSRSGFHLVHPSLTNIHMVSYSHFLCVRKLLVNCSLYSSWFWGLLVFWWVGHLPCQILGSKVLNPWSRMSSCSSGWSTSNSRPEADIQEYWILDLTPDCLHPRQPQISRPFSGSRQMPQLSLTLGKTRKRFF